jgi:hypothetical protein
MRRSPGKVSNRSQHPNSLLTGKRTGNFSRFCTPCRLLRCNAASALVRLRCGPHGAADVAGQRRRGD